MSTGTKSGASMTKSKETIKTFVTFRIAGDQLVPDEITKLLHVLPSHSHRKGEAYSTGKSTIAPTTGVWLFSTERITTSRSFDVHLQAALFLLGFMRQPGSPTGGGLQGEFDALANFLRLKRIIDDKSLTAAMTFFWHGAAGAEYPAVPDGLKDLFDLVPIAIETDFDREDELPASRRQKAA